MWCKEKAKEAGATLLNIHAGANEVDTKKKKILHTTLFTSANDSGVLETGCLQ